MRSAVSRLGLVCLVACLEPRLDVCGDLACPNGSRCVELDTGAVCAPPGGCDRLADGDACDPGDGHGGSCEGGACIAAPRCGDGVVDGNETCDCGDDSVAPRSECSDRHNSDTDVLSPCRANCVSRRCGDGIVDSFEQCEGNDLHGNTCTSLGYYRGSLACTSFCTFAGCDGRCGDGVLDAEEYCEPNLPTNERGYCADLGFSTGHVSCTPACGPSFAACESPSSFVDVLPGYLDAIDMTATPNDGVLVGGLAEMIAIAKDGTAAHFAYPGAVTTNELSAFGDRMAVRVDMMVYIYDATGLVHTTATPVPCDQLALVGPERFLCESDNQGFWCDHGACEASQFSFPGLIVDAYSMSDGTALVATDSTTYHVTATTSAAMSGIGSVIVQLHEIPGEGVYGGLAYGGTTYAMVKRSGESWSAVLDSQNFFGVSKVRGRRIYHARDHGGERAVAGPRLTSTFDAGNTTCRRFLPTGIAAGMCLTQAQIGARQVLRFTGASVGVLAPATVDRISHMTRDASDKAFMIGEHGVLETFPPTVPAFQPGDVEWAAIAGHDPITMHGRDTGGAVIATWRDAMWHSISANQFVITAIPSSTGVVAAVFNGIDCDIMTAPDTGPLVTSVESIACPKQLWLSPTNKLWSISPTKIDDLSTGSVYPIAKGAGIAGIDDTHLWAIAGTKILRWDGTTWTTEIDEPGASFDWIDVRGSKLVASSGGTVRTTWLYDGTSWDKLRLPGDPSAMIEPMLGATGIHFLDNAKKPRFSVWFDGWPP